MALTYTQAIIDARQAIPRDLLNNGKFEILDAGDVVLATWTLLNPSATITNGVMTFSLLTNQVTVSTSGTASKARFRTSADADVITGLTVGTSGTDILLDSVTFTAGQLTTMSALTVTHS